MGSALKCHGWGPTAPWVRGRPRDGLPCGGGRPVAPPLSGRWFAHTTWPSVSTRQGVDPGGVSAAGGTCYLSVHLRCYFYQFARERLFLLFVAQQYQLRKENSIIFVVFNVMAMIPSQKKICKENISVSSQYYYYVIQ